MLYFKILDKQTQELLQKSDKKIFQFGLQKYIQTQTSMKN